MIMMTTTMMTKYISMLSLSAEVLAISDFVIFQVNDGVLTLFNGTLSISEFI
jgi:hypothetical protein